MRLSKMSEWSRDGRKQRDFFAQSDISITHWQYIYHSNNGFSSISSATSAVATWNRFRFARSVGESEATFQFLYISLSRRATSDVESHITFEFGGTLIAWFSTRASVTSAFAHRKSQRRVRTAPQRNCCIVCQSGEPFFLCVLLDRQNSRTF